RPRAGRRSPAPRAASPCRRGAEPPPPDPPGRPRRSRPARPAGSAPRRRARGRARSPRPRRGLVRRRGLLLVLGGLRREADQPLAVVERVLSVDADLG